MSLEKQEVIEMLCVLATKVGKQVYDSSYASDCFCGKNPTIPSTISSGFCCEEPVMEFIVKGIDNAIANHLDDAYREKLQKEKEKQNERNVFSEKEAS